MAESVEASSLRGGAPLLYFRSRDANVPLRHVLLQLRCKPRLPRTLPEIFDLKQLRKCLFFRN